jgi:DNA-directed RNA polymerase subunit H (RpoH/RPB5)
MSPPTARRARKTKDQKPATARPFVAHHLAPLHEVLSEEETRRLLEQLDTSPERLPKILLSDPGLLADPKFVAQRDAGEALVGRLVRILRPSQTAGTAVAYRVIVASTGGS